MQLESHCVTVSIPLQCQSSRYRPGRHQKLNQKKECRVLPGPLQSLMRKVPPIRKSGCGVSKMPLGWWQPFSVTCLPRPVFHPGGYCFPCCICLNIADFISYWESGHRSQQAGKLWTWLCVALKTLQFSRILTFWLQGLTNWFKLYVCVWRRGIGHQRMKKRSWPNCWNVGKFQVLGRSQAYHLAINQCHRFLPSQHPHYNILIVTVLQWQENRNCGVKEGGK